MSRDARPLVGVIAGTGIDGEAWLRHAALPASHRWVLIDPQQVPREATWLVWLLNGSANPEEQRQDRLRLVHCLDRLVKQRRNSLVPVLFVDASPSTSIATDESDWRLEVGEQLRRFYRRRMNRVAPRALVEPSLIVVEGNAGELGAQLVERGQRLVHSVAQWRRRLQRQAAQCLKAGLAFTAVYVLMLLASFPWKPSQPAKQQARGLMDWTWAEWRQHLDACRHLLSEVEGKQWYQLNRETQAQFTQYLRWLPVSLDLLEQRVSTSQSRQYVAEIGTLLGQMEAETRRWMTGEARVVLPWPVDPGLGALLQLGMKQRLTEELLDNVFDPRPGATELHRQAEQFWVEERGYTLLLLRTVVGKAPVAERLGVMIKFLRDRLAMREASRVHAPNRKLAYIQEVEQALEWCLKVQQSKKAVDFQEPGTPGLIRETVGKSG